MGALSAAQLSDWRELQCITNCHLFWFCF